MAKVKKPKPSSPGDLWDYDKVNKPRAIYGFKDEIQAASDMWDVPVVDYVYYVLADMIWQDLKLAKMLKFRSRLAKERMLPRIMERLALLDYGKELLDAKAKGPVKDQGSVQKRG